jgi:hypothetical protein
MSARLCVGVVVLLLPSIAHAQMVSGRVTDQASVDLRGVTVTASSDRPGEAPRTVVTDPTGRYRLVNLQPAVYTLTFSFAGFEPVTRRSLDLTRIRSATVDTVMRADRLEDQARPASLLGSSLPRTRREGRNCLHEDDETAAEAARRNDALGMMRLIDHVLTTPVRAEPPLEVWARLPAVADLRRAPGPAGELARKIQWGSSEPLRGWGLAYVTTGGSPRYALTDLTDPCAFAYSSADPEVLPRQTGSRSVARAPR